MEENFNSTTINLGGNEPIPPIGGGIPNIQGTSTSIFGNNEPVITGYTTAAPVEPIIATTISTVNEPITVQAPVMHEPVQNVTSQVIPSIENNISVDISNSTNTIIENKVFDKPIVKTTVFQKMINNINKGRSSVNSSQLANAIEFVFNSEGFELKISDGEDEYISEKNNECTYNLDERFCIDNTAIFQLASSFKEEYIEFAIKDVIDSNNTKRRNIEVNTESAHYSWVEATSSQGTTFEISLDEDCQNVEMISVPNFKNWVASLKIGNKYSAQTGGDASLMGVLSYKDLIIGTDSKVINIRKNEDFISNQKLYFTRETINRMAAVDFGDNVKVGFILHKGGSINVGKILIQSDTVTFTGPMMDDGYYEAIPIEEIQNCAKGNQDSSLVVNKNLLLNATKIVGWFTQYGEEDRILMIINQNELIFRSLSGNAEYRIPLKNNTFTIRPITLDGKQVTRIIEAIDEEYVKIFALDNGLVYLSTIKDLIIVSETLDR